MKKTVFVIMFIIISMLLESNYTYSAGSDDNSYQQEMTSSQQYIFPDFYKGIYLNVVSARDKYKLMGFVEKAKKAGINTFVMDVQSYRYKKCIVPLENVDLCQKNGIHPIARIVVFPEGLKVFPVSETIIQEKIEIAKSACNNGFKEIQFDYIRFNDSRKLRHLSRQERYDFIEGLLLRIKKSLASYNVKIAADVFGRIPLNKGDIIGQRMEGLDRVVDIICPMAYPSHYTWSAKLQQDPYYTVYITSKRARDRTVNAEIVTYIQAFQIKLGSIPFQKYLREQIKAVHDAGIRGYLFWNARQDYEVPLKVAAQYYADRVIISEKDASTDIDNDS